MRDHPRALRSLQATEPHYNTPTKNPAPFVFKQLFHDVILIASDLKAHRLPGLSLLICQQVVLKLAIKMQFIF